MHAAPANDVLEVSGSDGDLLVPFTADAIVELDLASRRIVVRADLLVAAEPAVQIDVFTLFPEWFDWMRRPRHLANAAISAGLELRCFSPRDTTPLPHAQVDDSPYGGGPGMVMRVDVMAAALEAVYGEPAERRAAIARAWPSSPPAAARSPTPSPASWPTSPPSRCSAGATRASTSA